MVKWPGYYDPFYEPPTLPLCGMAWLQQHRNDYTQAEIDNLTIVVKAPGSSLRIPNDRQAKGIIKNMEKGD